MKIYCSCCDKVQPVRIDNCRDAKTNEPFQDIVCAECDLVIAAGTDIVPPAQQQEPVAWMKDCADFWEHYTYISEVSQENYKAEAQMWVEKLRTSPQPIKPWVGLSTVELDEIDAPIRERGHATVAEIYRAIEAKLREKNA